MRWKQIEDEPKTFALIFATGGEIASLLQQLGAVVERSDGTAQSGYLLEARVRPTCELILTEIPIHLQKKYDLETGIVLIQV
jgi:predicted DNA-binding protein with PD1-like motif